MEAKKGKKEEKKERKMESKPEVLDKKMQEIRNKLANLEVEIRELEINKDKLKEERLEREKRKRVIKELKDRIMELENFEENESEDESKEGETEEDKERREEEERKFVEEKRKECERSVELYKKEHWIYIKKGKARERRTLENWLKSKVKDEKWVLHNTRNKEVTIVEFISKKRRDEFWKERMNIKREGEYLIDEFLTFEERKERYRYLKRAEEEKIKENSVLVKNKKIKINDKWYVWGEGDELVEIDRMQGEEEI